MEVSGRFSRWRSILEYPSSISPESDRHAPLAFWAYQRRCSIHLLTADVEERGRSWPMTERELCRACILTSHPPPQA
jgi:hypothetical protein